MQNQKSKTKSCFMNGQYVLVDESKSTKTEIKKGRRGQNRNIRKSNHQALYDIFFNEKSMHKNLEDRFWSENYGIDY